MNVQCTVEQTRTRVAVILQSEAAHRHPEEKDPHATQFCCSTSSLREFFTLRPEIYDGHAALISIKLGAIRTPPQEIHIMPFRGVVMSVAYSKEGVPQGTVHE